MMYLSLSVSLVTIDCVVVIFQKFLIECHEYYNGYYKSIYN